MAGGCRRAWLHSIRRVSPDELIEDAPLQPFEGWQRAFSARLGRRLAGADSDHRIPSLSTIRQVVRKTKPMDSRRLVGCAPKPWHASQ